MSSIETIAVLNPTPVMTQIAKPTVPNTQFKPVAKPIIQEKPKFPTINLFPPVPPKPVEVEKVKPSNIEKPKPTLKIEEFLPLVALGGIAFFILSRNNENNIVIYNSIIPTKNKILHFDTIDGVGNYDATFAGRQNGSGQNVTSTQTFNSKMSIATPAENVKSISLKAVEFPFTASNVLSSYKSNFITNIQWHYIDG